MSEEEKEKEEKEKEIEPAAAGAEKQEFKIPPPSQEKKGIGQEIKEDIGRATPGIAENVAALSALFVAFAILVIPPWLICRALTYNEPYTTWWGQTYYITVYPPIWVFYVSCGVSSALACAFFTKFAVEWIAKVPIKRTSYVYRAIANLILPLFAFCYYAWRDIKQSIILAQAGTRTGAELKAPQVPTTVRTYATREAALGDLEDIVQGAPKTAEKEEEEKEKKREGTKG